MILKTIDLYVPWNWHELAMESLTSMGTRNRRRHLRGSNSRPQERAFKIVLCAGACHSRRPMVVADNLAWLLSRPEYNMRQHEILEGRYPVDCDAQNVTPTTRPPNGWPTQPT